MVKGYILRDAIISASNNISSNRQKIDELNVFPVPDGDTGTNMSMTIGACAKELAILRDDVSVTKVADTAASALLRGARGNSGVILSLLFRGFSKGLKGMDEADGKTLVSALQCGVDAAYNAVMKPTEGTILTVARVAAEKTKEFAQENGDEAAVWEKLCENAGEALKKTPEQLPVLKKAGVVDAGGMGLLVIFKGMLSVFKDGKMVENRGTQVQTVSTAKSNVNLDDDIKFTYCTEFIVERSHDNSRDALSLRAYLESIGDCVVVVDDDSIIKVHVHTNNPGKAIQAALKYGMLINIKIDNMRVQHRNTGWTGEAGEDAQAGTYAEPEKEYGFVAVAAGEGLQSLFTDLGVDNMVRGGQTMNPSTDDILAAVNATPAETVFVLPNNKNIIMAAEQVIPLTEKKVSVLPTKTIPQGITAMLNFDPDAEAGENHMNMMKAAKNVSTGSVTFAARDSDIDGMNIKEGQILGLEEGKPTLTDSDAQNAAYRITKRLIKRGSSQFVTLIYGENIDEAQAQSVEKRLKEKYGDDIEVTLVNGGQPVYYYIISVE